VLREKVGATGRIVAVDLLPMDPVAGATFVQADFREDEGLAAVAQALGGKLADLVVSDMAPNLSGVESADQARSVHLGELALDFAVSHLRDGGDLAIKVFQGSGLAELQRALADRFDKVYVRKPKSSRDRSRETFLVGKGFVRKSS
jgi:23S rRNA (uridine2552-2'-O)-methyltransferase